jgi:hypothetical protein
VFNNAIGRTLPNFVVGTGRRRQAHSAWVLLAMASLRLTWPLWCRRCSATVRAPSPRRARPAPVSNMLNSRTTITSRPCASVLEHVLPRRPSHHPPVPFHHAGADHLIARQLETTSFGYIAAHARSAPPDRPRRRYRSLVTAAGASPIAAKNDLGSKSGGRLSSGAWCQIPTAMPKEEVGRWAATRPKAKSIPTPSEAEQARRPVNRRRSNRADLSL